MYKVEIDETVTPEEVIFVREETVSEENILLWLQCIKQSMCVVSARDDDGKLVGIGFLVGNQRHGELVDLSVHPSVRQKGIGEQIVKALVLQAHSMNIKYFGLTWDTSKPWLKAFYERHGFKQIDFCMWHQSSLPGVE